MHSDSELNGYERHDICALMVPGFNTEEYACLCEELSV